ncbi:hypothetical protein AM571_PA00386 (plasmid) [Rhizobium etli 8C-3]|uniref:Uncharacterized protein n=1 Tax=Rhizobium etli 8C-3 TaxID=538025 RepID=A0A1L5PAW5_RHIET|nr:hypothetical protein AM571_PA00386 [Rhizobium etli 8C-3]
MAVAKTGDDRTAPVEAGMKWRAAGRNFVAARGMAAKPSGEESFGWLLREERRSRSPVRHASSSPRMERR